MALLSYEKDYLSSPMIGNEFFNVAGVKSKRAALAQAYARQFPDAYLAANRNLAHGQELCYFRD